MDFTDVKNVTEGREGKGRRGPGSVFYWDWKAYALKFLKLQNLDQIHCRNIELDFC